MVVFLIPDVLLKQTSVPTNLEYIPPADWSILRNHIEKADEDAYFTSCAMEFGLCLCFGCLCIFCCHSCIYESFDKKYRRENVNKVNVICFEGKPIFSVSRDQTGVFVNSDYFINNNNIASYNMGYNNVNYNAINNPYHQNLNQQNNFISVTIPEGVQPGDKLNVVSPDGQNIMIVVPTNCYCGQVIQVSYTPINTAFPTNPKTLVSAPPNYNQPDYSQQYNNNNIEYNNNNNDIPFTEAIVVNDDNIIPTNNAILNGNQKLKESLLEKKKLIVVCPPGVEPGMELSITTPENQQMIVTIPFGTLSGGKFQIEY